MVSFLSVNVGLCFFFSTNTVKTQNYGSKLSNDNLSLATNLSREVLNQAKQRNLITPNEKFQLIISIDNVGIFDYSTTCLLDQMKSKYLSFSISKRSYNTLINVFFHAFAQLISWEITDTHFVKSNIYFLVQFIFHSGSNYTQGV